MALTKDEIKAAYPLPAYNYKVEIGSDTVAFSEVSGLSISHETTTYKESPVESGSPRVTVTEMSRCRPVDANSSSMRKRTVIVPAMHVSINLMALPGARNRRPKRRVWVPP